MTRIVAMRKALGALLLLGFAACSYIFELPATQSALLADAGDAATDATGGTTTADVAPFCSTRSDAPLYCTDFDGVSKLDDVGYTNIATGSTFAISSQTSLSPGQSLHCSVEAGGSGTVTRAIEPIPDVARLVFDLYLDKWDTRRAVLSQLMTIDKSIACKVALVGTETTWALEQSCEKNDPPPPITTPTTAPIATGRWQHFEIRVSLTLPIQASLFVDGEKAAEVFGLDEIRATTGLQIALGIESVAFGSVSLFQDNVLVVAR